MIYCRFGTRIQEDINMKLKKVLAVVMSLCLTAGAVSYAGTAAAAGTVAVSDLRFALGDANRDGAVNLKDAVVIRRYIAEGWDTEIDLNLADVNGDSTVNLKDAVMLRRYIAGGWDVTFKAAA